LYAEFTWKFHHFSRPDGPVEVFAKQGLFVLQLTIDSFMIRSVTWCFGTLRVQPPQKNVYVFVVWQWMESKSSGFVVVKWRA
jgi:hypothetical protein